MRQTLAKSGKGIQSERYQHTRKRPRPTPLSAPSTARSKRTKHDHYASEKKAQASLHATPSDTRKRPQSEAICNAAERRRWRRWRRWRRQLRARCRRGRSSTPGLRTQTHKGCPLSDARAGGSCTLADTVCATDRAKPEHISGFLRPDCCAHRAQLTELAKIPPWIAIWRRGTHESGPAAVAGPRLYLAS